MAIQLLYPEKISRKSSKTSKFVEVSAQFGDSYYQAAPKGLNPIIDVWNILWVNLSLLEKQALETSLNSIGSWGTLLWTPSYELVEKRFHGSKDGYITSHISGNNVFQIKCKLIQRFDS